jgi:hypothetical protein
VFTVILAGHVINGGVTSCMITLCVVVDVLPWPSLNVQVITVVPCAVIGNTVVVVPVIVPAHTSCAVGATGVDEHCAVMFDNVGGTGGVISSNITFCVTVDVLPLPSLNVQVITVVPCAVMGNGTLDVAVIVPAQLSCAVGAVGVDEHCAVTLGNDAGASGGVISSTITFCNTTIKLPFPSLNIQWMTCVPCVLYVNGSIVNPVTVPAQLSVVVGTEAVALHWPVIVGSVGVTGGVISCIITF